VAVGAVMQDAVQIHECIGRNCRPEFLDQFTVKAANLFSWEGDFPHERHTTAEVDRGGYKCLFHGEREVAVAVDAAFVTQSLLQTASKADAHILDRVMLIDMQVAAGLDGQVEQAVSGEQGEHVIEEADARVNLRLACSIQRELQGDLSFRGAAVDGGGAMHGSFRWSDSLGMGRDMELCKH